MPADRREFLAGAAATLASVPLAGCGGVTTNHQQEARQTSDEARATWESARQRWRTGTSMAQDGNWNTAQTKFSESVRLFREAGRTFEQAADEYDRANCTTFAHNARVYSRVCDTSEQAAEALKAACRAHSNGRDERVEDQWQRGINLKDRATQQRDGLMSGSC